MCNVGPSYEPLSNKDKLTSFLLKRDLRIWVVFCSLLEVGLKLIIDGAHGGSSKAHRASITGNNAEGLPLRVTRSQGITNQATDDNVSHGIGLCRSPHLFSFGGWGSGRGGHYLRVAFSNSLSLVKPPPEGLSAPILAVLLAEYLGDMIEGVRL